MGVRTGRESMAPASGQELREPLKQPGREGLATRGGNSALPLSAPLGAKAEVMGSGYAGKHSSNPRDDTAWGKGETVSPISTGKLEDFLLWLFLKNACSGGCKRGLESRPKASRSLF